MIETLNKVANALAAGASVCGIWYALTLSPLTITPALLFGTTLLGCALVGWIFTR